MSNNFSLIDDSSDPKDGTLPSQEPTDHNIAASGQEVEGNVPNVIVDETFEPIHKPE